MNKIKNISIQTKKVNLSIRDIEKLFNAKHICSTKDLSPIDVLSLMKKKISE